MSGAIPEELISQIKERTNILDVVSDFVPLKKTGINYKGLCPFHSEKTPSFTVNEEKQIFHCFGCGAGGNAIVFLMKVTGMSFPDAVEELAKKAGVSIPRDTNKAIVAKNDKLDKLYKINEAAASFYQSLLNESDKTLGYLGNRGLSKETINDYRLGFGGEGWDSLVRRFSSKGVSLNLAEELGLIIQKKSGGYYDRFRERVIFPIIDTSGRVIGFGGRTMDGSEPKYLNSPESVLFKKSDSLYGLSVARRWIKEADEALIVEGYMDLLSLHQAGIKNSVATLGTALTLGHLRIIKRFTTNAVTIFDADSAGIKATLRATELFLAEGLAGKVLSMPDGHDPDSFVREFGGDRFKKGIKSAKPLLEFLINYYLKGKTGNDIQAKLRAIDKVLPYIGMVLNQIEQWHYIKILSELTGIKEELIRDESRKRIGGAPRKDNVISKKITVQPETWRAEKNIVQLTIKYPELKGMVDCNIFSGFNNESLRSVGERIYRSEATGIDLLNCFESEEVKGTYRRLVMEMPEFVDPVKELEDSVNSLRSHKLKKEREKLRKEMEDAVRRGDDGLLMELRERHKHIK